MGAFLAPQFITYFAVAARLLECAKNSLRAATTVLTPAVSAFEARGESRAIRAVFIDSTRYVLWFILPVQAGLPLPGKPFLALWMGPEYVGWSFPTMVIPSFLPSLVNVHSLSGRLCHWL